MVKKKAVQSGWAGNGFSIAAYRWFPGRTFLLAIRGSNAKMRDGLTVGDLFFWVSCSI